MRRVNPFWPLGRVDSIAWSLFVLSIAINDFFSVPVKFGLDWMALTRCPYLPSISLICPDSGGGGLPPLEDGGELVEVGEGILNAVEGSIAVRSLRGSLSA